LYTHATGNMLKRVYKLKNKLVDEFTNRYNLKKYIYYKIFDDVKLAIEKEIF